MKVTPAKKKFGKYEVGDVFELKDRPAKLLIKVGKLRSAEPASTGYQTRDMRAIQSPAASPVKTGRVSPHGELGVEGVAGADAGASPNDLDGIYRDGTDGGPDDATHFGHEGQEFKVEEIPHSEEPAADNEIESGAVDEEAPYGRKADGTPKKRPGRAPAAP